MSSTGIGVGASMIFVGVKASPSFEYSGSAFCADASDPTPTINGTPGGTFTAAPVAPNTGTLVINSSTGTVDLSASDVGNYLVTYTVAGKSESDPFEVLAVQSTAFSYSASSFKQTGTASPTITGNTGGVFTATTGLVIDANTGVIDLAASTIGGPYTITYTNTGACQGTPSTFDVSITAAYASTSSFSFDGVNDYFEIPYNSLNFNSGFSISAWFKWDGGTIGTSDNSRCIISRWSANSYFGILGRQFILRLTNATPNIQLLISPNGSVNTIYTGSTSISSGVWYHVAVTWDTNNYKVILNGNTGTPEINQNNTNAPFNTTTTPYLTIGATYSNSAPALKQFWSGLIDEVSIWDSALSSDAVTEIYNSGEPNDLTNLTNASSSNLKAWYKMGE